MDRDSVSSAMGVASIGCWVVAQAPQFWENYQTKSCEGLAFPFLLNWLCGDITNLLGCVLTDQKEFQTLLATYFCLVDVLLTTQFVHYHRRSSLILLRAQQAERQAQRLQASARSSPRNVLTEVEDDATSVESNDDDLIEPSMLESFVSAATGRSLSQIRESNSRAMSLIRSKSVGGRSRSVSRLRLTLDHSESEDDDIHPWRSPESTSTKEGTPIRSPIRGRGTVPRRASNQSFYHSPLQTARTIPGVDKEQHLASGSHHGHESRSVSLTEAALIVAIAAERVERRLEKRRREEEDFGSVRKAIQQSKGKTRALGLEGLEESGEEDVSSSPVSATKLVLHMSGHHSVTFEEDRGRSSRRSERPHDPDDEMPTTPYLSADGMNQSRSRNSRSRSKAGGRARSTKSAAAGVVFMGIWSLIRFGTGPMNFGSTEPVAWNGRVISPYNQYDNSATDQIISKRHLNTAGAVFVVSFPSTDRLSGQHENGEHNPEHPGHVPSLSTREWWKRVIGRISAWVCTTLYLTSRLPQIWKNYQRKSVEGLSILLFVFAFCGNLTYVLSIILNPTGTGGSKDPEIVNYYLLESLPYLLGSGGTLVFDLTIMIQSLIYGSAPPIDERDQDDYVDREPARSRRSRSTRKRSVNEETRPLMDNSQAC